MSTMITAFQLEAFYKDSFSFSVLPTKDWKMKEDSLTIHSVENTKRLWMTEDVHNFMRYNADEFVCLAVHYIGVTVGCVVLLQETSDRHYIFAELAAVGREAQFEKGIDHFPFDTAER